MVKTAVILAAGMGSRIKERTKDKPKGFIEIEGKTLIEMSISKLIESGIEKIIIGTGYLAEAYQNLESKYPQVKCHLNNYYEFTGSMYTLYNLRNLINEDFILLESDILYDKSGLNILLEHPKKDVILASNLTNSGDEVFIETSKDKNLVNMSKKRDELQRVYGELTGISKISYETYKEMCSFLQKVLNRCSKLDYESVLVGISTKINIYVENAGDFTWCEIDCESHLSRAKEIIFPTMKVRELGNMTVRRNVLLNPGPATTTDTVKFAQVVPDICPREEEFGDLMEYISNELTRFVGDTDIYTTVLFGGSGTAAVEAIISSVVGEDVLLIVNNGAYGKRICHMAEIYNLNFIEYKSSSVDALDLIDLEQRIRGSTKRISHLAIVHNETTTGLLNDISSVGELCSKYNIDLIVDCMSSFAAIPIDMKKINISYLASSSNKNIQGMAGVSFVIANKDKLEGTKVINPKNLYLNLFLQYKHFKENKQMRFTPPVQTLYALKQAIEELKYEGIEKRYERYTKSWETLISGLTKLGLRHVVSRENHSMIITSIIEPDCPNFDFNNMHDYFYSRGITIYPGKIDSLNTFRVANIGDISFKEIETFIELLKLYLEKIGWKN